MQIQSEDFCLLLLDPEGPKLIYIEHVLGFLFALVIGAETGGDPQAGC